MRRPFTATLALSLMIAACGDPSSGDTGDGSEDLSGSVQVLVIGDAHEAAAYGELVAAFEDQAPGIDVELVTASDRNDQMTRLSTSFSAGRPPDLFVMNYRFVGQFAERDVLVPLDELVAGSEAMGEADFYEAALDAFRFDQGLLCLPQNLSSLVVYYNKDLFAEEGVTEPEENWQWMDFVEKAKVLTKDLDGDEHPDQYGIGIEAGQIIRLAPFIWSAGAELVDDQEHPTRFELDSPEARAVLGNYFALRRAHQVIPTEEEVQAESDEARFINGRTAMLVESRRVVPVLRSITEFDWDVAPLPLFGTQQGVLHSDGYCMTRGGTDQGAAWRFMEFALSEEGATIMAQTGRTVPSRIAVAESDAFLDPDAKPANSQVFIDAGPNLRSLPHISTWPEIEAEASPILESAMYHDLPPETLNDLLMGATGHLFEPASED